MRHNPESEFKLGKKSLTQEQLAAMRLADKLARDLWEGFQDLGEEFEVWLLLAVNGGIAFDESGEQWLNLSQIATVIEESGVLDELDLGYQFTHMVVEVALKKLREHPDIVLPERQEFLRKEASKRNAAKGAKVRQESFQPRLEKLLDILQENDARHRGRLNHEYIIKRLQDEGFVISREALRTWIHDLRQKPEYRIRIGIFKIEDRFTGGLESVKEVLARPESIKGGKFNITYIAQQFRELGVDLSPHAIAQWLMNLRRKGKI